MSKRPSLAEALHSVEDPKGPTTSTTAQDSESDLSKRPQAKTEQPPSRQGTKTIAGHFDPAVSRQFRILALEQDKTGQDLLGEALNGLFKKYGKPPIA